MNLYSVCIMWPTSKSRFSHLGSESSLQDMTLCYSGFSRPRSQGHVWLGIYFSLRDLSWRVGFHALTLDIVCEMRAPWLKWLFVHWVYFRLMVCVHFESWFFDLGTNFALSSKVFVKCAHQGFRSSHENCSPFWGDPHVVAGLWKRSNWFTLLL